MSNARVGESERHAKGFLYTGILLLWLRALAGKAFVIRKRTGPVRISIIFQILVDRLRSKGCERMRDVYSLHGSVVYVLCVLTLNGCEEDVIPLKEILMTRSHVLELALREVLSILSKFTEPGNTPRRNHVSLVSQPFARTLAQSTPKSAVVS